MGRPAAPSRLATSQSTPRPPPSHMPGAALLGKRRTSNNREVCHDQRRPPSRPRGADPQQLTEASQWAVLRSTDEFGWRTSNRCSRTRSARAKRLLAVQPAARLRRRCYDSPGAGGCLPRSRRGNGNGTAAAAACASWARTQARNAVSGHGECEGPHPPTNTEPGEAELLTITLGCFSLEAVA